MRYDQLETWCFLEEAAHNQAHRGHGGVEQKGHTGYERPLVKAVHIQGYGWVHIDGHPQPGHVLKHRAEFRAVDSFLVNVRKEIHPLKPELVDAAVDLSNGSFDAAPAQGGPSSKLAGILSDDASQMVVDARGPGIGLVTAQQFWPWHPMAEH